MIRIEMMSEELKRAKAMRMEGPQMWEGLEANRWIGHLGELALARWMRERSIYFQHELGSTRKEFDFIIGGIRVEMKTRSCIGIPPVGYSFEVSAIALLQTAADEMVFATFDDPARLIYIAGFAPMDFVRNCSLTRKGESVGGRMPAGSDMRSVFFHRMNDPEVWLTRFIPEAVKKSFAEPRIHWARAKCWHCRGTGECMCISCYPSGVCVVCE